MLRNFSKITFRDVMITIGILLLASVGCFLLQGISESDTHVPLIFVLAIFLISLKTQGYLLGIIASVGAVFGVNFVFTYPYFAFNFTLTGYPLTFLSMLAVSFSTSTLTSQVKEHEQIKLETEREKMRANLLRAISHDLRTPLTSIIGTINTVLENEESLPHGKRTELLTEAKGDAQWLIRMVENLLSVTRIGDGEAHIEKQLEAAEEILGEAVGKFKKQYPGRKVCVAAPEELLMVPMDAMLIEQVLMNLMENSVAHGKTVSAIEVSVVRHGEHAEFCVADNGCGLEQKDIPNLFSGYLSQVNEHKTADSKRNMGIGLSVCTSIVRAHGGEIFAQNRDSGGAEFRFTLPLREN